MKKPALILLLAFAVCAGTFAQTAEDFMKSGDEHFLKGDYDKAIADFETVLYNNQNSPFAQQAKEGLIQAQNAKLVANENFINSGFAHYEKKEYDQAIADFEAALKLFSNNARAKEGLEKAKKARGN